MYYCPFPRYPHSVSHPSLEIITSNTFTHSINVYKYYKRIHIIYIYLRHNVYLSPRFGDERQKFKSQFFNGRRGALNVRGRTNSGSASLSARDTRAHGTNEKQISPWLLYRLVGNRYRGIQYHIVTRINRVLFSFRVQVRIFLRSTRYLHKYICTYSVCGGTQRDGVSLHFFFFFWCLTVNVHFNFYLTFLKNFNFLWRNNEIL